MPTLLFKGKNIIWNHHLSIPYHTLDEVAKLDHLLGNADSQYKQKVLDLMTKQRQTDKVERYQAKQMDLFRVNEHIECYFVEENKEEESLRSLFK